MYDLKVKDLGANDNTAVNYNDELSWFIVPDECILSLAGRPEPIVDDDTVIGSVVITPPRSNIKSGKGRIAGYAKCTDQYDKIRMESLIKAQLYGSKTILRGLVRMDASFGSVKIVEEDPTVKSPYAFKWNVEFTAQNPFWYLRVPVEGITVQEIGTDPSGYQSLGVIHEGDPTPPTTLDFNNVNQFVITNRGTGPVLPNIKFTNNVATQLYIEDIMGIRTPVPMVLTNGQYVGTLTKSAQFYTEYGDNLIKIYDALVNGNQVTVQQVSVRGSYYRWY